MKKTKLILEILAAASMVITACGKAPVKADSPNNIQQEKHWSYSGDTSPEHWFELNPEYAIAKEGTEQSPINIVTEKVTSVEEQKVEIHYVDLEFELENNGHTIELVPKTDQNYIMVDDVKFTLAQAHFHASSEHQLDGSIFEMELHMVNKDAQGNIAVIGVFINPGQENETLKEVFQKLPPNVTEEGQLVQLEELINLGDIIPANSRIFRYQGSLTTPPCTEGVKWVVYENHMELSSQQIDAFKAIYNNNCRPVQPLNQRDISVYTPN